METQRRITAVRNLFRKKWVAFISIAFMILLAVGLIMGVSIFSNKVYVTDMGETKKFLIGDEDVEKVLKDNNYNITPDDTIILSDFVDREATVRIIRAYEIPITADKKVTNVKMSIGNVAEALAKAGITVSADDIVTPSADTEVNEDTKIVVKRVMYKLDESMQEIPYETTTLNSAAYKKGDTVILKAGENGTMKVKTMKEYIDGELVDSQFISEEVVTQPVSQLIALGAKASNTISQLTPPSDLFLDENGIPINYKKIISGSSAAYSARPGAKTASGRLAEVGTVAVDPNVIPYGTELYIVSKDSNQVYGYAIAADTGTAIMDGVIVVDLFFGSYEASCQWGRHDVNIYVL